MTHTNNRGRKVGRPKYSSLKRLPIGREEHETILQHINQMVEKQSVAEKLMRICTILHHTGMRASEVLLLKKGMILSAMNDGKFSLNNQTKTKTPRLIMLSKNGIKEFKELFEMEGYEYENENDYIFVNKHGKQYTAQGIVRLLNTHIKEALGELFSSHSYRAGYIRDLFKEVGIGGGSIVRELVGHSTISVTLRYLVSTEQDMADVLEMAR